jgi:hypothetical protein
MDTASRIALERIALSQHHEEWRALVTAWEDALSSAPVVANQVVAAARRAEDHYRVSCVRGNRLRALVEKTRSEGAESMTDPPELRVVREERRTGSVLNEKSAAVLKRVVETQCGEALAAAVAFHGDAMSAIASNALDDADHSVEELYRLRQDVERLSLDVAGFDSTLGSAALTEMRRLEADARASLRSERSPTVGWDGESQEAQLKRALPGPNPNPVIGERRRSGR